MFRGLWVGVALVATATVLAACTSSGPAKRSVSPSSPAPTTTSSVITSSTPTPTTTPAPSSSAPLSPFEEDPAVKALRRWAVQLAKTINTGEYDSPALDSLMTAGMKKLMKVVAGTEVGRRYSGPVPFTPVRVTASNASTHDVRICVVAAGFSTNPATGKAKALKIVPIDAGAVRSNGTWLVSKFFSSRFSCKGVAVPEPRA